MLLDHLPHGARRLMVACLLVALPLSGWAGVRVAMLGALHHHAQSEADPMAGWQDLRRVGLASAGGDTAHRHDALERHHHGAADADASSHERDAEAGGAGLQLPALAGGSAAQSGVAGCAAVRRAVQAPLRAGVVPAQPERPPRG